MASNKDSRADDQASAQQPETAAEVAAEVVQAREVTAEVVETQKVVAEVIETKEVVQTRVVEAASGRAGGGELVDVEEQIAATTLVHGETREVREKVVAVQGAECVDLYEVRVFAFGYRCATGEGRCARGDVPLGGATISIEGSCEEGSFCRTVVTGADGRAVIAGLGRDCALNLSVRPPASYRLGKQGWVAYDDGDRSPWDLEQPLPLDQVPASVVDLEIGFAPEPGHLRGRAYADLGSAGRVAISGSAVYVARWGDGHEVEPVECTTTLGAEDFDLEIACPGLIAVEPAPTIETRDGLSLRLASTAPIVSQVGPGQTSRIELLYVPNPAHLRVAAQLVRERDGKTEVVPAEFPVTFSLYAGSAAQGMPVRRDSARGATPLRWSDLEPALHTLVVEGPPSYGGRAIVIESPSGGILHLSLNGGRVVDLVGHVRFREALGRVMVSAHDRNGGPVAGVPVALRRPTGEAVRQAPTGPDGVADFAGVALGEYVAALVLEGDRWLASPARANGNGPPQAAHAALVSSEQHVVVSAQMPVHVAFQLEEDLFDTLAGYVRDTAGAPVPHAVVRIVDALTTRRIAEVAADASGRYSALVPRAAVCNVQVVETPSGTPLLRAPSAELVANA